MGEKIKALFIAVSMVLLVMAAGCGQDPAKLPPDQLLQKALDNARKAPGAFDIKKLWLLAAGQTPLRLKPAAS